MIPTSLTPSPASPKNDTAAMASELSRQLRGIADEFLTRANKDRPEHLEAILSPSLAPVE